MYTVKHKCPGPYFTLSTYFDPEKHTKEELYEALMLLIYNTADTKLIKIFENELTDVGNDYLL